MTTTVDVTSPEFLADPYGAYRAMNAQAPVTRVGPADFVVTDPDLILEIFADHVRFTSAHNLEGQAPVCREAREILEQTLFYRCALFNETPPEHSAFRRTFIRPFTPAAVDRLAPSIDGLARDLCRPIAERRSFDVMTELAFPLPITVVSDLIGIPQADGTQVKQWNDMWVALQVAPLPPETQIGAARAVQVYEDRLRGLISRIAEERTPSLILEMVDAIGSPGAVHDIDDIVVAIRVMIAAGHETTSGLIGNAVARLIGTGRWDDLAASPDEVPAFVEETLAVDPSVQSAPRSVEQDTRVGGVTVPAGARLHLAIGAYAALAGDLGKAAEVIRVGRTDGAGHIGFGHGIHRCVGSHLARTEACSALRELVAAVPGVPRLDPAVPPDRMPGGFVFRGFRSLPIVW